MKKFTSLVIFATAAFLASCNKSHNSINHINCDNLINDTLDGNDHAKIYMPNAFTPNDDGLNDHIIPITANISTIDFIIYDETNNIVFETKQLGQGWANAPLPSSYREYYYKIQATTTSNEKIGMCGELYALKCIPSNMTINDFHFQDQLAPSEGFTMTTNELFLNCG